VLLRVYTRLYITRQFGLDDYLLVVANGFLLSLGVVVWIGISVGGGRHSEHLSGDQLVMLRRLIWVSELLYSLTVGVIKVSILALYIRIFPSKRFGTVAYSLIGFNVLMTTAFFLVLLFQCLPLKAAWNLGFAGIVDGRTKCVNEVALQYSVAALYLVTDIATVILPMRTLLALQMSKSKKYELIGMFSIGGIVCLISLARLTQIKYLLPEHPDPSWNITTITCWSCAELGLGLMSASGIAIRPLFHKLFPAMSSDLDSSSQGVVSKSITSIRLALRKIQDPPNALTSIPSHNSNSS